MIFVGDTFTDTAGTGITSHTGELGATWSVQPGGTGLDWRVTSAGRLAQIASSLGGQHIASGVPPSANYGVRASVRCLSVITEFIQIQLRSSNSQYDAYATYWDSNALLWNMVRVVNGSFTTLGTSAVNPPTTPDTTYIVELTAVGSVIEFWVDGARLLSATDTVLTAAGFAGFGGGSGGSETDTNGLQFDEFVAFSLDPLLFAGRVFSGRKRRAGHSVSSPGSYF